MDHKLIVQTLKSACGNKNFRFQVIIQNSKLHIYINHKTEIHPGHAFLNKLVVQAIAPLPLTEYKGAWLYSRKLGDIEPNWRTYIEFPLAIEVDEMDTIGNSHTLSMGRETGYSNVSEVDSGDNRDLLEHSGMTHKDAPYQAEVDTFAHKLVDENEAIENLYDFELAEFSENSSGDTGLLDDTGMIHKAALHEEEINTFAGKLFGDNSLSYDIAEQESGTSAGDADSVNNSSQLNENEEIENLYDFELDEFSENSSGDTGLLDDTGMIHKAALCEEEINTFAGNLLGDNSLDYDIAEQESGISAGDKDSVNNSSQLNLAQYCFVTNKKILTGDIIPPDKETIRLVKLFHHLSDNNKEKILPVLDDYFKLAKIPDMENFSVAVQKWFKQITELDDDHRYTAEIWLSRYCFASSVTLEEFKAETARSAAIATEKKKNYSSEYSFTPTNTDQESATISNLDDDLNSDRFSILSVVQKYILPLIWTTVTVLIIVLGINTNNSFIGSKNNPSFCNSTIGSQAYCRFGVNLVGEKKIKQLTPSVFPLTPVSETEAMRGCQRYANLKAEVDVDPIKNPVLFSYGEKIFPHIYVVEARQKSVKDDQPIKVGCVYTTGSGESAPKLVKADVIPADIAKEISFGMYTNAINLGLYTIFTAIGLAIASQLKLGIRIRHLQTIYLVALAVAIVQSLVSFVGKNLLPETILPVVTMLAILPVVTMLVLSWIIKDFKLNRNFGYSLVAVGIGVVIATEFLLYGLFQILINALV